MDELLSQKILTVAGFLAALGFAEMLGVISPKIAAGMVALAILLVCVRYLWLWFPDIAWLRFCVLTIGLLLAVVFVRATPETRFPVPDKSKIRVGLQYAHEWDEDGDGIGYKGSKNTNNKDDWWRIIDEPIVGKYSQDEKRLLLGVDNLHKTMSIKNIHLEVFFQDDGLKIRNEEHWGPWVNNKHYFTRLGNIVSGPPKHPGGSLWIKFPRPGNYKIKCKIYGDDFDLVERDVEIILKKPTSDK